MSRQSNAVLKSDVTTDMPDYSPVFKPQKVAGAGLMARPNAQVIALRQRDPWREASDPQRSVAIARADVVEYVLGHERNGLSAGRAIELLLAKLELNQLHPYIAQAVKACAKAGRAAPTRSTIFEWRKIVVEGGSRIELLESHKGRVMNATPAWWGPALEFYNNPSKPDMAAVFRRLYEVEGLACTYDQVRNYLSSVPAMVGRNSPARLGKNLYRLTQKAYVRRSTQNALAGDVYVADGYRADVYLAHPITGDIWRPELTVAMDLRSRVIVGWRADEHEGTHAVQNMWAEAFARHNHVPPFLYVDNGSGYKNKLMSDDVVGFYKRAGVQEIIHAIPGNPHGKGWIERFFHTAKDDFFRLWMPQFYCGTDANPEALSATVREVKAGRIRPPSLAQFNDGFNAWLERYASRAHPEHKDRSKASFWAELVAIPPASDVSELKRQAATLTVNRAAIKHGKRSYQHPDLLAFAGDKVLLEYDLMDDTVGVVRTLDGRWICDAHLVTAIDVIAPNRMAEKRQLRAADAIKRLAQKMDEQKARAGLLVDAEATAAGAAELLDVPTRLISSGADDDFDIDITDLLPNNPKGDNDD